MRSRSQSALQIDNLSACGLFGADISYIVHPQNHTTRAASSHFQLPPFVPSREKEFKKSDTWQNNTTWLYRMSLIFISFTTVRQGPAVTRCRSRKIRRPFVFACWLALLQLCVRQCRRWRRHVSAIIITCRDKNAKKTKKNRGNVALYRECIECGWRWCGYATRAAACCGCICSSTYPQTRTHTHTDWYTIVYVQRTHEH